MRFPEYSAVGQPSLRMLLDGHIVEGEGRPHRDGGERREAIGCRLAQKSWASEDKHCRSGFGTYTVCVPPSQVLHGGTPVRRPGIQPPLFVTCFVT